MEEGGVLRRLAVDPPLTAKVRHEADGVVVLWMVTSAASLLEGDELVVSVRVAPGARLVVRTVAAQLVHPAPGGATSASVIEAQVGAGGSLLWWPEPTIVSAGACFRSDVRLDLAAGATCRWREELVLGRSGEDPAELALATALRADLDGVPLLRDGLRSGAGWRGPATIGSARYIGTVHQLGEVPPEGEDGWFRLAGPGRTMRVLHDDPVRGRVGLAGACSSLAVPAD